MPTLLMVRVSAGFPSASMNGGTSCTTLEQPPMMDIFADAAKLMHGRQPADDRVILHDHVPGQGADVGHDDMASQRDIVREVTIGQQMVVRADVWASPSPVAL